MRPSPFKADALLLLAAAIWGSGFVAQRLGMDHVGPMVFNAVRFAIGCGVLLPVIWMRNWGEGAGVADGSGKTKPVDVRAGVLAGSVLFVAAALQQIGMISTTAGKGGFITGFYVVLVPVLGLLIRVSVARVTWAGAGLAMTGLYFLCVSSAEALEIAGGDWFVFASAFFWAAHVLVIGRFAPRSDPLRLAAAQFAVASLLAAVAACLTEQIDAAGLMAARWAILYSGVFSIGVAFGLQVIAQRDAPPAHAAILLSLEAVFAAIAGGIVLSETLDGRQIAGCACMLAGGLLSQIRRRFPAAVTPRTPQDESCG